MRPPTLQEVRENVRRFLADYIPSVAAHYIFVGGGAIICPGVKIGSRSVIGAGSIVTKDVPAGVFAAGNPCRVIRELTE